MSINKVYELTKIDKFFLYKILKIIKFEKSLKRGGIDPKTLKRAKRLGFSDKKIAQLTGLKEKEIRDLRKKHDIKPVYKMVDTCAAEFEAKTPYYYGSYDMEDEVEVSKKPKVLIIGSGPIRIGQGIEFDYCCVHATMAFREKGFETIMVNNNPETVSTDYDISDKLYFEPLTLEDVLAIINKEKPASFEPSIDYVVTKIPRWPFDKFREIDRHIGVQMKSTGEVMAILAAILAIG